MSKTIEQDAQKRNRRVKIGKIVGIAALVLVLAWTAYSVAMNLNKNERMVVNSFIKAFRETKEPASNELLDCSKMYEGQTNAGKKFQFVIASIRQGGNEENCLLIVDGKGEGKLYTAQTLSRLDFPDKDSVQLDITERDESMHLKKMQKMLLRYWQFHDVA